MPFNPKAQAMFIGVTSRQERQAKIRNRQRGRFHTAAIATSVQQRMRRMHGLDNSATRMMPQRQALT